MNNNDLNWCIDYLYQYNHLSREEEDSFNLFRGLMNITMPYELSDEYYHKQDNVLQEQLQHKKIIDVNDLEYKDRITIYRGDITCIKADSIVNACNEKLLGCFVPLHNCIDNAIHSFAGLQVRRDLMDVMNRQGHDEENGLCKVTKGYNLPSQYIFHTVGPKVFSLVSNENKNDLRNCYLSCLKKAEEMKLDSIVFPCISTGIYGYPKKDASSLAYETVKNYFVENKNSCINKVIFNVFGEEDYGTYKRIVG